MKNKERGDAAVVSALQTTIVTGDEVNGSVLLAAHGLREEGDEPLVWQQEGEVIQIEHHYGQRCADGQRALHYEKRHETMETHAEEESEEERRRKSSTSLLPSGRG